MSESIRRRKDPDHKAFVRNVIRLSVSFVLMTIIGLIAYFVPYRSTLSAYRLPARAEGEFRLHFVSVGQGDCTIVEFPDGDCLIVDGGDGSFEHTNRLCHYVNGLNAGRISLLATHSDVDHWGGFPALLEFLPVDAVYLPGEESDFSEVVEAAQKSGVAIEQISRYKTFTDGSAAYAVCLSPRSLEEEAHGNDVSVVLYLRYGDTSALLSGDISAARENLLLREYALDETIFDAGDASVRLDVDILKAAHHGSSASSSEKWLSALSPEVAVISCGKGNVYGHPAAEAVERLSAYATIYRTDECGDILITMNGTGYTVLTNYAR